MKSSFFKMWRIITIIIRLYLACRSFFLIKLYLLSSFLFPLHFIFFHCKDLSQAQKPLHLGSWNVTVLVVLLVQCYNIPFVCFVPRTMLRYVCCLSTLFSSFYDVNIADEGLQLIVYNYVLCTQLVEQWRLFVMPRLMWH